MNGIFVIYLNVGTLAPKKIEEFVKKQKDNISDLTKKLNKDGYEVLCLPARDTQTRAELIRLK